jgi:hypothetical protein
MATLAVACTSVFCGILVFYLASYAHITNLGLSQAHARVQLRQLKQDNEILREQNAQLESPDRILAAATALGMVEGQKRVCYVNIGQTGDPAAVNHNLPNALMARTDETHPRMASIGTSTKFITTAPVNN